MIKTLPPTTYDQQIDTLKERGMLFNNEERACKYLSYIGYHRLSFYWSLFYKNKEIKDKFNKDIWFEDVLGLYIFDRKLRSLFFEASERIEICTKVLLSNTMSTKLNDSVWYNSDDIFKEIKTVYYISGEPHEAIINKSTIIEALEKDIKKIKDFGFKNFDETPIDSWLLVNEITFGCFSKLLNLIEGKHTIDFYSKFKLPKAIFDNWLECVVNVRNICAHYGFFFKRSFSTSPKSLSKSNQRDFTIDLETFKLTFFAQFYIFSYLIYKISPTSSWVKRVAILINNEVDANKLLQLEDLGFPDNWENLPIFAEMLNN